MWVLRRGLVAFSWMVLAACGPAKGPPPEFVEGTRLKAVYLEAEGAPRQFVRWYDPILGVDCAFADVGLPDRLVCFPTDSAGLLFVPEFLVSSGSGCTDPLVPPPRCNMHFVGRVPKPGDPCGTPAHLFSVLQLASDAASTCGPRSLHMGPEIPLETLVSGTYHRGPGPGRIVPLTIVASDGSVQGTGSVAWFQGNALGEAYLGVFSQPVAWDNQRDEMVSAIPWSGDGVASLWHPIIANFGGLFQDATCGIPAVAAPACPLRAAATKEAFAWSAPDACGNSAPTGFVELQAPGLLGAGYYDLNSSSGTCESAVENPVRDPTSAAFPLGAPIPPTEFAEATELRTGTKQLQLREAGTADGHGVYPLGWASFFDGVHGLPCEASPFYQAADGMIRCLPPRDRTVDLSDDRGFFADAACKVPIAALGPPGVCGGTPPIFAERSESVPAAGDAATPTDCPPFAARRRHFYPIGDRYEGAVYDNSSGTCIALDSAALAERELEGRFRQIGPEIPPSDFGVVKYVHPD